MARVGYRECKVCGKEFNVADLVSGYCRECRQVHVEKLAALQREYQEYLAAGDEAAALRVGDIITAYEKSERLRLKDASHRDTNSPKVRLV